MALSKVVTPWKGALGYPPDVQTKLRYRIAKPVDVINARDTTWVSPSVLVSIREITLTTELIHRPAICMPERLAPSGNDTNPERMWWQATGNSGGVSFSHQATPWPTWLFGEMALAVVVPRVSVNLVSGHLCFMFLVFVCFCSMGACLSCHAQVVLGVPHLGVNVYQGLCL